MGCGVRGAMAMNYLCMDNNVFDDNDDAEDGANNETIASDFHVHQAQVTIAWNRTSCFNPCEHHVRIGFDRLDCCEHAYV